LIAAAVQLFSTRSPGAVTTRELAVRAGVNQGLIYRQCGSKEALVRAALDAGVADLLPASMDAAGFDLDATIPLVRHRSPAAAIIARTLVDGIDMTTVRPTFPVIGRLVQAYPDSPSGAGHGDLTDPRLAVAATAALVTGSAIWDRPLRIATGIDPAVNLDHPIATLARLMLNAPSPSVPVVRGRH
jgi:AcrR family transcriptional regulator